MSKYNFEQKRNDYMSPPELVERALQKVDRNLFITDVCCSQRNIPASFYFFNGVTDGLKATWSCLNWCNPPYDECEKWIKKASEEQQNGKTTVMLIPARVETEYWHKYILDENGGTNRENVEVQFLRKGYSFIDPETNEAVKMKIRQKDGSYKLVDGVYKNPLALVYFYGKKEK